MSCNLKMLTLGLAIGVALTVGHSPQVGEAQGVRPPVNLSLPVLPKVSKANPQALRTPPRRPTAPPEGVIPSAEEFLPPSKVPIPDPTVQLKERGALRGEAGAIGLLSDPDQNFAGINPGFVPPDTVHDVGPNHIVQMTNGTFWQVWDKEGNDLSGGALTFGNLWPAGDNCNSNLGDPIVVYDHLADRWLLSQFTGGPNGMCIAISRSPVPLPASITGDPADGFFLYTLTTNPPFNAFPDYPKFGVWPDGYYMTSFETNNLGIFVFDRQAMLNGNAVQIFKTTIPALGAAGVRATRILPSDLDGAQPPDGTPNFFVRTVDDQQDPGNPTDRIEVYEAAVDWTALTFTFNLVDTITAPSLVAFDIMTCNRNGQGVRDCIPQPDSGETLDALSNRPMMQAKFRNFGGDFRIVFNQTIDIQGSIPNSLGIVPANEVAGVRWYELENTGGPWDIRQQGTYAPQPIDAADESELLHRWMGSLAIDGLGNLSLGYSIVNGDSDNGEEVYPGIRYTGRRFDDPLGLMQQGENIILNGAIPQGDQNPTPAPVERWGDYAAMTVDPRDDCTFWYTTHVAFGATQIASFRFDTCGTDLAIAKSVTPDPGKAGEQLIYTISVSNDGPLDATNVVVIDTLPPETTFVTDTDSCVEGPVGVLTCELGDIANGGVVNFEIKVDVASGLNGPTSITNTATVTADQLELDESNNEASITTIIDEMADLQVSKLCKPDGPAMAGANATCTMLVDNLGPSDARNVVLTDQLVSDGAFTVTSFQTSQGACVQNNNTVTCNLGNIAAGQRAEVEVTFASDDGVDVNDIASVTSDTPDPNTDNNQATGHVTFTAKADLAIAKTDSPDPVQIGQQLTYDLTVTNNGPSAAANVVIEDILPAGVVIDSVTSSAGTCNAGVPGDASQPTVCTFDTLASGGVETMQIVVTVPASVGATLSNDAMVSSDVADPDNSNNLASTMTAVVGADIWIDKVVDTSSTTNPSRAIVYFITVHNVAGCQQDDPLTCGEGGPSSAENVLVSDTISSADPKFRPNKVTVTFLSPSCQVVGVLMIECDGGTLPPGGSATFELHLDVKGQVDGLLNTASVTTTTFDPDLGNNTDAVLVDVAGGGGNTGGPKP